MSAFKPNYLPPSNRRRCAKKCSSYTEQLDHLLSAAASKKQKNNSEESYIMSDEFDSEESVTINLSTFLNDQPLLFQEAFESDTENNVATESSSQFRVTDCKVDLSQVTNTPSISRSTDINTDVDEKSCDTSEKIIASLDTGSLVTIHDNLIESCLSPPIKNNLNSGDALLSKISYSSILNNTIINGFNENDFEDSSFDGFKDILPPPTSDSKKDKLVINSVLKNSPKPLGGEISSPDFSVLIKELINVEEEKKNVQACIVKTEPVEVKKCRAYTSADIEKEEIKILEKINLDRRKCVVALTPAFVITLQKTEFVKTTDDEEDHFIGFTQDDIIAAERKTAEAKRLTEVLENLLKKHQM